MVVCARPPKPPFSPRDCAGDPGIIGIIPRRSSPDCALIEDAPPPLIGSMQLNIMPPVMAPPQFGCVLPFMDSNIRASLPGDADPNRVGFTFDSGSVDGSADPCDLKLEAIIRLPPLVFDMDYDDWATLIDSEITAAEWVVILGKLSAGDWATFPIDGGGGGGDTIIVSGGGGGVIIKVVTHTLDREYVVEVYENGPSQPLTRIVACTQLQLDAVEDTIPADTWAIATEILAGAGAGLFMQVPIWLPDGVAPETSLTLAASTGNIAFSGLPADGDTFILEDGINPAVTFEFDSDSSVVPTPTLIAVVIPGAVVDLLENILSAVNFAPLLLISASDGAGDSVDLQNQSLGAVGNIPITGIDSALVQNRTGMAGGAD